MALWLKEDRRAAMDPDLAMQRLVNGLIFMGGAAVAGTLAVWLVGWWCRRTDRPGGVTLLAQGLTLVAMFYAGSLYLDAAGLVAPATVESKDERITYTSRGTIGWNRSLWATVRFTGNDGPTQGGLWLDAATFDALRPGAPIDVRYVSWFPHIARPASASTRSLVPWRWLVRAALAGGTGIAIGLLLRRRSPLLMFLTFAAAIVAGVTWLVLPAPWLPALDAPVRTAQAEVRRLETVTRSFINGRRADIPAPQPWELVELQFVPEGGDQPVVAVDGVDAGSVPGLAIGARVPVSYNARDPRDARLPGPRTYRWREWRLLGEYAVTSVAAIAGLYFLSKLASFWWRKLTQRT
jgi:hypothetical protein